MKEEENEIVNRVAQSALTTLDLEAHFPIQSSAEIDLKDFLHEGLILREKDLRDFVKTHPWNSYEKKNVAVYCSADAIIPTWAYMLIALSLEPFAGKVFFGTREAMLSVLYREALEKIDWEKFRNARVVIKGCSNAAVPESAPSQAISGRLPGSGAVRAPLAR